MPVDLSIELRLAYLRAAHASQQDEERDIATFRDFFEGDQGVKLSDRQKEYLSRDVDSFGNICKRTVNIIKDRLEIDEEGIRPTEPEGEAYAGEATRWWSEAMLGTLQKDLYEASLRDGNTALIVGWDEVEGRPTFKHNLTIDANQTGLVRFHYDSDDNLIFASKRWTVWDPLNPGETGRRRLTVYRPDLIERYEADPGWPDGWRFLDPSEIGLPNPQIWTMDGTLNGEPIGIPVIPFDNPGGSELEDVLNIQELINHSLGTFDIANDFHGWPFLWFVNANLPVDSTTGKSIIPDNGPGQAVLLGEGGAAGRIEPADLKMMFEGGVISQVQILALVKGWPVFIFDRSQQPPSGIALQIMESSLVKQVEDKQAVFGGAWAQAFDIARKLSAIMGGGDLPGELDFVWKSARTADEKTQAETQEIKFRSGEVPVIQRWRELGYTQDQIDQMLLDKQREDDLGLADVVTGIAQ